MKYEEEEIPFNQLKKLGITKEDLIKNGGLEKLLNGEKTDLLNLLIKVENSLEPILGQLKLKKTINGKLSFEVIKADYILARKDKIIIENVPFLEIAKYGITEENLRESGNLDKLLNGEKTDLIEVKAYFNGKYLMAFGKLYLIEKNNSLKFRIDFETPQILPL